MTLSITDAIQRFDENENRINKFVNELGTYTTNSGLPAVETLPSFMQRNSIALNLLAATNVKGAWAASTEYSTWDEVQYSGTWYRCVVAHISTSTFDSTKWRISQGVTSGQLSSSNGGELVNVTLSGSGAVVRSVSDKLADYVSVKDFGAKGDGVTDDTLSIQAALNTKYNIYLPPSDSTYIVGNLNFMLEGQSIHGAGHSSCLQLKTGVTGAVLNGNGKKITIDNIRVFGGDDSGKSSMSMTEPTSGGSLDRSGIYIDSDDDLIINRCIVHGFGNRGIKSKNSTGNRHGGTEINSTHVYNCWAGLDLGLSNAEYLRGNSNSIGGCQIGLISASGNQTFCGGIISDNYTNVQILGTGVPNNAHGSIVGCLLNHATKYAIQAIDVTNGFIFDGCNIFYGEIYLKNSSGVIITDGIFDVVNFYFEGGGLNVISNNFTPASLTNNVNHNWNSTTSNTILRDNFTNSGMWSKNSVPVVGIPNYAGAGDYTFLQWGETGTVKDFGFVWTSDGSNGRMKLFGLNNGVRNTSPTLEMLRTDGKIYNALFNLQNFANDTAAATGGIPIGGLYRNGSVVQIRVA